MAPDKYQMCPCGSGLKVKFCCKDLAQDLEKIRQKVEGDQRASAMQQLDQLIEKRGPMPVLLQTKASLQIQTGHFDKAEETVLTMLQADTDHSAAHALSSILDAAKGNTDDAVRGLQRALELVTDTVPSIIYDALSLTTRILVEEGRLYAGRGHLLFQARLAGEHDPAPMKMLLEIDGSASPNTLIKQDLVFAERPADAEWAEEYDKARELAGRGAWLASCEKLEELARRYPNEACIRRNLGYFRGLVASEEEAAAALRDYAKLDGLDADEAIEAEALAQVLDPATYGDTIDEVMVSIQLTNADTAMERLLSHSRVSNSRMDPDSWPHEEDEPAPKSIFSLFDKEIPTTAEGLTIAQIPFVIAEAAMFGKQTDREARLNIAVLTGERRENAISLVEEILGDALGERKSDEEVIGQVSRQIADSNVTWQLPEDTPPELAQSLADQERTHRQESVWPKLAQPALMGKSIEEAASDEKLRIRTLAAILRQEISEQQQMTDGSDKNSLRKRLKLPERAPIDPTGLEISSLPLCRLALLESDKLDDQQLISALRRSALQGARLACKMLAREAAHRESVRSLVSLQDCYRMLLKNVTDANEGLEVIVEAKQRLAEAGESPAQIMLQELMLRLQRGEVDEFQELLTTLQSRHITEPGIREALYSLLIRLGVIRPDQIGGGAAGSAPGQGPPLGAPDIGQLTASQDKAQSALWTPGAGPAAAPPSSPPPKEGGESKLWVPGMD